MSSYAAEGAQQAEVQGPGPEPDGQSDAAVHGAAPHADAAVHAAAPGELRPDTPDTAAADEEVPGRRGPDRAEPGEQYPSEQYPGEHYPGEHYPDEQYPSEQYPSEPMPVSKLAVVALLTGILPLVPIAVVTGIAALLGIRRSGRRGHGLAKAALIFAAAWVVVGGGVATVGVLTHGFKKPEKVTYHEASVFKLQEGDCIDTPNGQTVTLLPCASPHDAEVFATFTLPATAWPGTAAVAQDASSGCGSRLSGYLNPQLTISIVQTYVYPNQASWTAGTRTVICEVRAASGQLTQSVRGSS